MMDGWDMNGWGWGWMTLTMTIGILLVTLLVITLLRVPAQGPSIRVGPTIEVRFANRIGGVGIAQKRRRGAIQSDES